MDLGDALKGRVNDAFEKLFQKYRVSPVDLHVWFQKTEHKKFLCEILCHLGKKNYIKTDAQSDDVVQALHDAVAHVDDVMRRHKKRLDDHHKHHDNHKYKKGPELFWTLEGVDEASDEDFEAQGLEDT